MGKNSLWTRNFTSLLVSNFLMFLGFQMLLPIIPQYTKILGGTGWVVGTTAALISISAILTRFNFIKPITEKKQHFLVITGQSILIVSFVLYLVVHQTVGIMVIRFLHGIGWGLMTTLNGNTASKIIPVNRKGEGFSYYGFGTTLALAIGPFISLTIVDAFSYRMVFIVSLLITVLSVLTHLLIKTDTESESETKEQPKSEITNTPFHYTTIVVPVVVLMMVTITYSGLTGFLSIYQQVKHLESIRLFFVINALCAFCSQIYAGRLTDKKGYRFVIIPAVCSLFIGLLLVQLASSTSFINLAAIFYGFGFGATTPTIQTWLNTDLQGNMKHLANFIYYNAFDIGMFLGSIILGSLADYVGYVHIFGYSLGFIVIALMVALWPIKSVKEK